MDADTEPLLNASKTDTIDLRVLAEEENTNICDEYKNDTSETECKRPIDAELPNKKYHLYVIYSHEDLNEVTELCEKLENIYQLKCMFAVRDFVPGVPIDENCKHKMEDSHKTLILTTPNTISSFWCDEEIGRAFKIVKSGKRDFVIPVLFKPLSKEDKRKLRPCLEFTTYIDAAREDDLAKKIFEAYVYRPDGYETSEETWGQEVAEPTPEEIRKQNGARLFSVRCQKSNTTSVRGSKWSFPATHEIAPLPDEPEVPEMYEDIRPILNESIALRYYGVFFEKRRLILLGCTTGIQGFVFLPIILGGVVIETRRYENIMDMTTLFFFCLVFAPLFGVIAFAVSISLGSMAMQKTERRVLSHCLKKNDNYPFLAFIQCALWRFRPDEIIIIRYDLKSCKTMIHEFLINEGGLTTDVLTEEDVNIFVEEFLFEHRSAIIYWIPQMPFSCINRHNTWKTKQCVCEMFMLEYPYKKKLYNQAYMKRTRTVVV